MVTCLLFADSILRFTKASKVGQADMAAAFADAENNPAAFEARLQAGLVTQSASTASLASTRKGAH
jgi:hypothetical protein